MSRTKLHLVVTHWHTWPVVHVGGEHSFEQSGAAAHGLGGIAAERAHVSTIDDWMLVASEDATAGSVMAKQEAMLPCSSGTSHRFCCSRVP